MKKLVIAATIAASAMFGAVAAHANSGWVAHGITLNARSGPGTNYHVVAKFHACTKLHVMGYQYGWAKVSYNHHTYWVSGKYLQNHACQHYNNNNHNNNYNNHNNNTYVAPKKKY